MLMCDQGIGSGRQACCVGIFSMIAPIKVKEMVTLITLARNQFRNLS